MEESRKHKSGKADKARKAGNDFERADILNEEAHKVYNDKPERCLELAKEAQAAAERAAYDRGLAQSKRLQALAGHALSRFDEALANAREALALYRKISDIGSEAYMSLIIGKIYYGKGDPAKALEYCRQSLQLERKLGNPHKIAVALNAVGSALYELADYDQALEYHLQALDIAEEHNDTPVLSASLLSIGNVYFSNEDFAIALDYHQRALEIKRNAKPGSKKDVALSYNNLGVIYFAMKDYPKALEYQKKSLAIMRKANVLAECASTLGNMGRVYQAMGQAAKALKCEQESLAIAETIGSKRLQVAALLNIGKIHCDNERAAAAVEVLEQALAISGASGARLWDSEIHEYLSKAWEAQRDFEKAYRHYKAYARLRNETLGKESQQAIQRLQMRHDMEKARRDRAELHRKLVQSEHKMLRAQINPHFVFNALNSVQHYLTISDKEGATRYLARFARLMRLIMDNSRHSTVLLRDELQCLELYLEMEQLRFSGKFKYDIKVDPELEADEIEIPPMIMQAYVENAIWHGLLPRKTPGTVTIQVSQADADTLLCVVEDNGIGRAASMRRKKNGDKPRSEQAGTALIAERFALLKQSLDLDLSVEIEDLKTPRGKAAGTRISLKLPSTLSGELFSG